MAKNRYLRKDLEKDLIILNEKLEKINHEYRLVVEGRNGYIGIDLATPAQIKEWCCSRTLVTGTARECLTGAQAYVIKHI